MKHHPPVMSNIHKLIRFETTSLRSVPFGGSLKTVFGPYTIGKSHLTRESWIYIMCYLSKGVTTVCRSVRFVRIVNAVYSKFTVREMHLIKRFKRKSLSFQGWCHNKKACRYAYIPRSLNVSDNMVRLKRKKYQSRDFATTKKPVIDVYIVL